MRTLLLTALICVWAWQSSCSSTASTTPASSASVEASSSGSRPNTRDPRPADEDYDITIKVPNVGADTAFLAYYQGDTKFLKDTALNQNGTYRFKGDESLPGGLYLVVFPPKNIYFDFVVNKDQTFTLTTDTTDFAGNMKVKGSDENEIFYDHIRYLGAQREGLNALNAEFQALADKESAEAQALKDKMQTLNDEVLASRRDLRTENPNSLAALVLTASDMPKIPDAPEGAEENWQFFYYRNHFWDNLDLGDSRMVRSPVYLQKVDEYLDKLTYQQADSLIPTVDSLISWSSPEDDAYQYMVSTLLNKYADKANKIMGMDGVYLHIVEKYYASGNAWWIDPDQLEEIIKKAEKLSPIIIGRPGQDFAAPGIDDQPVSLYSMDADWTILYFWDYDCGRCKKVTPELAKVYPKYADKGVALYTVSINGDKETWLEKLEEYGLDKSGGVHTSDPSRQSGFGSKYNINSTPKLFILDKDKIIRYKWIGVEQLSEILDRELGLESEDKGDEETGD